MMSLPSPSRSLIRQKTELTKDDSDSKSSIAMTWDKVRLMVCSVLVRRTEADRNGWKRVEEDGRGWKRVEEDGRGWKWVEEDGRGWKRK